MEETDEREAWEVRMKRELVGIDVLRVRIEAARGSSSSSRSQSST